MLNLFLHIFVPTDEQWQEIRQGYIDTAEVVKGKIPFVQMFSDELKTAQETVSQTDFLIITIPEFSFSTGTGISKTSEQTINFSQRYEPYRMTIRTGLLYIVYGTVFVFLIKHILNYTQVSFSGGADE